MLSLMFWGSQEFYVSCFGQHVAVNEIQKGIIHILDVIQCYVVRDALDEVFLSLRVVVLNPQ